MTSYSKATATGLKEGGYKFVKFSVVSRDGLKKERSIRVIRHWSRVRTQRDVYIMRALAQHVPMTLQFTYGTYENMNLDLLAR